MAQSSQSPSASQRSSNWINKGTKIMNDPCQYFLSKSCMKISFDLWGISVDCRCRACTHSIASSSCKLVATIVQVRMVVEHLVGSCSQRRPIDVAKRHRKMLNWFRESSWSYSLVRWWCLGQRCRHRMPMLMHRTSSASTWGHRLESKEKR